MTHAHAAYVALSEVVHACLLDTPTAPYRASLLEALEAVGAAIATDDRRHALLASEHRELRAFLAKLHRYMQSTDAGAGDSALVVASLPPADSSASERPSAPALHVVTTEPEPA